MNYIEIVEQIRMIFKANDLPDSGLIFGVNVTVYAISTFSF